jgi:type III secretion protein V
MKLLSSFLKVILNFFINLLAISIKHSTYLLAFLLILLPIFFPLSLTSIDYAITISSAIPVFLIPLSILSIPFNISSKSSLFVFILPSFIIIATALRLGINIVSSKKVILEATASEISVSHGNFLSADSHFLGLFIILIVIAVESLIASKFSKSVSKINKKTPFNKSLTTAINLFKIDVLINFFLTVFNFTGGLFIATYVYKMPFQEAFSVFSLLSTGCAITALIPSFFTAISIGIILMGALNPGKRSSEEDSVSY